MKCWIVTEAGLTGTENQCLGVADALGADPVVKRIGLRQPWKALSPWLGFECARAFTGDSLEPPWPDLLIAGGRKAIAAARYIKKSGGGKTFTVFLQDPRIDSRHFDLVAVPAHDSRHGENVIVTQATPNRVTAARLAAARKEFAALESLPSPRVAVLIGGSSKAYAMTPDVTRDLAGKLKNLAGEGCGLMITASRRTGEGNKSILASALQDSGACIWDGAPPNPYYGFLAWADYIIVTGDSASMISEAATTGKPVYMVRLEGGSPRFDRLHNSLLEKGIIRLFDGRLEPYGYTALNDAAMVAGEIRKRL